MSLTSIDIKWRICLNGNILGRYRRYYIKIKQSEHGGYCLIIVWCSQLIYTQGLYTSILSTFEKAKSFAEKAIIEHINDMPIELNQEQKEVIQQMRDSKMIQWPYYFLASPTYGPLTRKQLDYLVEKDILHYECSAIRDTAYYSLTELGKNLEL